MALYQAHIIKKETRLSPMDLDLLNLFDFNSNQIIPSKIPTRKGRVKVTCLSSQESKRALELEHEKRYSSLPIIWSLTVYCFLKNNAMALWVKSMQEPTKSRKEILWSLGRNPQHYSSLFYDRISPINHDVKIFAASWRALDIFYNYHQKVKPKLNGNLDGFLARYFMGDFENRQSVTNRYKIVSHILTKAILHYINRNGVKIISIASGAAQAIIEVMHQYPEFDIKAVLIDLDETALDQARMLAGFAGMEDRFSYIRGGPNKIGTIASNTKPQIIEMIGFLDYRPRDKAISLIRRIYNSLPEGGLFLTCNIRKNPEKPFLDWVVLWPMIYRNEQEFAELLIEGGFPPENIQLIYEPFRIHGIAVCRK